MIVTLKWNKATENFCANWLLKVGDPNPQFTRQQNFQNYIRIVTCDRTMPQTIQKTSQRLLNGNSQIVTSYTPRFEPVQLLFVADIENRVYVYN